MGQNLIDAVRAAQSLEHINLPVQAGDDEIIQRMRRRYTLRYYRDLVRRIRETIPGVTLATDIIVGFPGETADQFMHTLDLLEEIRFDKVHVAAYSPRPGTVAAAWPDDVPHEEKMMRLHAVENLQERDRARAKPRHVGEEVEFLVEGASAASGSGPHPRQQNRLLPRWKPHQRPHRSTGHCQSRGSGPWSMQGSLVRVVQETPPPSRPSSIPGTGDLQSL